MGKHPWLFHGKHSPGLVVTDFLNVKLEISSYFSEFLNTWFSLTSDAHPRTTLWTIYLSFVNFGSNYLVGIMICQTSNLQHLASQIKFFSRDVFLFVILCHREESKVVSHFDWIYSFVSPPENWGNMHFNVGRQTTLWTESDVKFTHMVQVNKSIVPKWGNMPWQNVLSYPIIFVLNCIQIIDLKLFFITIILHIL